MARTPLSPEEIRDRNAARDRKNFAFVAKEMVVPSLGMAVLDLLETSDVITRADLLALFKEKLRRATADDKDISMNLEALRAEACIKRLRAETSAEGSDAPPPKATPSHPAGS